MASIDGLFGCHLEFREVDHQVFFIDICFDIHVYHILNLTNIMYANHCCEVRIVFEISTSLICSIYRNRIKGQRNKSIPTKTKITCMQ